LLAALVKLSTPVKVLASPKAVELAAVMVMAAVPSKPTLLIVRAVASFVAVEALPDRLPLNPPLKVMEVDVALPGNG
jgi:hypothetical protein